MDSIEYYNKYAAKVFEDTVNLDMDDVTAEFLSFLEEGDTILDLGCGSGRDSLTFYEHGYDVTALDASEEMCKLAEIHTGLEVLHMTYEEMEFEDVFDGIWSCSSLVHIPKNEMPDIFKRLSRALKSGGILYMSFKEGDYEGFKGERYYTYYTEDSIEELLEDCGRFETVKIWVTKDHRTGQTDTSWLNVLARRK